MRVRKKYTSGAATNYVTRRKAMRKLQLSLNDFRRLCILKGIYPHEPQHKKKVNKGSTENHIYYYVKDVNFLAHDPIIKKFRDYKIFLRRLTTAKAKREEERVKHLHENKPEYQLDYIVKERYPTFTSALRDLDDPLCLCFAFSVLPHTSKIPTKFITECYRLTAEFNHFVIESQALTKVFVSIKGIYYQAEIMGEKVTWLVAHERGIGHVEGVDFAVMTTFVEFYVTLLSFVNYRLYRSIGLFYPPKIAGSLTEPETEEDFEKIYCLARPLNKSEEGEVAEPMPDADIDEGQGRESLEEKIKEETMRKRLFFNCRFWLNREVPKTALTLVIRSCGGTVSWDDCPAALFKEDDPRITHQIIDRPMPNSTNVTRAYVQPQWIFDSFNVRKRLPVEKYLPGSVLPPHLSPFTTDRPDEYIPPERIEQLKEEGKDVTHLLPKAEEKPQKVKKVKKDNEKKEETKMSVELGRTHKKHKQKEINEKGHDLKLREMMIAKKHKRVYQKIKYGIKRKARENRQLAQKRAAIDAQ
ncbi:hypothetical protein AB6A40_007470 [Gnathostoma spinigerum]|uniref:Pescadillo homolog n=1 Tax=Gnathostoma spinigerum TaxID=75299 RepID=A0ABD6ENA8_9BILA